MAAVTIILDARIISPASADGVSPASDELGPSRRLDLRAGEETVAVVDDPYSDRIRCDHAKVSDPASLGKALLRVAEQRGRGRVVVMAEQGLASGLEEVGFQVEGSLPKFYRGTEDCKVLGAYPDPNRGTLAQPQETDRVLELALGHSDSSRAQSTVVTRRASEKDAGPVAALLDATFSQYPTPSGDAGYIQAAIHDGVPFRVVEEQGEIVACASADLVCKAQTAELTDCASQPEYRGRGFMQAILHDLMEDLVDLGYPTAFTLARSRIAGVNVAFRRLGFQWRGTMPQSCRIGESIEDMNIWSRILSPGLGLAPSASLNDDLALRLAL